MKAAMSEPVDMERATAAQKAFVILRACLYFAAWVSLMLSVSIWHVWTPKFTAAVNMYQNDAYWQDYKSVCIITQQFPTYVNTAWNNPDGLKSLYPGTTQDRDECNFFLYSCIVGIVYAFLFFMITLCLLGNKRLKFKYLEILELSMAMLLALSCMIAASLATDGISKSCKMYSNDLCESDCKYHRKSSSCEDSVNEMFAGYSNPPSELVALEPSIKWLYILRDGLWAACFAFLVLAIILGIRYRTVHRNSGSHTVAQQPDVLGELGAPSVTEESTSLLTNGDGGYGAAEEAPEDVNPFLAGDQPNPFAH